MSLRFTDGQALDTDSPQYYVQRLSDGCYVVGKGVSIPVRDVYEGHKEIAILNGWSAVIPTAPGIFDVTSDYGESWWPKASIVRDGEKQRLVIIEGSGRKLFISGRQDLMYRTPK